MGIPKGGKWLNGRIRPLRTAMNAPKFVSALRQFQSLKTNCRNTQILIFQRWGRRTIVKNRMLQHTTRQDPRLLAGRYAGLHSPSERGSRGWKTPVVLGQFWFRPAGPNPRTLQFCSKSLRSYLQLQQ